MPAQKNILNPIARIDKLLEGPTWETTFTVTGTLKEPPYIQEIAIGWTLERSTNLASIYLEGLLITPPDYFLPFQGPGFWPDYDPNTTPVESGIIPFPPWETTDLAINVLVRSNNHVDATISLYNFYARIPAENPQYLPIVGIG